MSENAPVFEKPNVTQVLYAVVDNVEDGFFQAERITINVLESGEVTYKMHPTGSDDFIGGVATVAIGPQ